MKILRSVFRFVAGLVALFCVPALAAACHLIDAVDRLTPGFRLPIRLGDNQLGTLSGTLVLQRALELVFTEFPELRMISMGFKDKDGRVEQMNLNQTAVSRILSIPAVKNFGDAASDQVATDVPITLDGFKQVLHELTPAQYNATDRNLIDEAAYPMAVAIAQYVIGKVSALWTSRNFTRSLTVANGWTYANTLKALRTQLAKAGVPKPYRFGVLNADVYDKLLEDPLIIAALNNPANGEAIRTGQLPQVSGIMPAEYPDLATNNGTARDITATAATDLVNLNAHGFLAGDRVMFPALTGGTGLTAGTTIYHVIADGLTANAFKVSATAGGAAVDITANATAGTVVFAENLLGFAGSPDSTIYVARPPKNPEEVLPGAKFPGILGYITEPKTGFTIMVNQWIGTDLKLNNRLVWLDGYAKGNGNTGVRLIRA